MAALHLSAGEPGIGGELKHRPEDFLVDEIGAYEPSGSGEHIAMLVEKRNLSTLRMAEIVAAHFGVEPGAVGFAGLKDKRAVTRQMITVHVPGRKPEDFPALEQPSIKVLWVDLHANKLRRGHLKGNRFSIKVRDVDAAAAPRALRVLRLLERVGAPNRVGMQRFGHMQNNHLVGRAILLGDDTAAVRELVGPSGRFPTLQADARAAFAAGDLRSAYNLFPRTATAERVVIAALRRSNGTPSRAVKAIPAALRQFYLTAFQSAVFNRVLDDRLARWGAEGISRLREGDIAIKHDNGAAFRVTAETIEDPSLVSRLDRLEISPSGPMWAGEMMQCLEEAGEIEREALAGCGVTPAQLSALAGRRGLEMAGARRALRIPVGDVQVEGGADEWGPYVRCAFTLPAGAFATSVMQEVMKPEPDRGSPDPEDLPGGGEQVHGGTG